MKPEINAATDFLSRVFLAHDRISKEKVTDFKHHLASTLEERFVDHWHESSPTKGQAFRCIRVCPEEALDPILEKVCNDVGINTGDFHLPFELTLWVDPTEVVCKFGDLKCSYHTVAKKDESGELGNQSLDMDIEDLVENARELYMKKQSVVIHPINSSEMHIPDGTSNHFTMAIRMNGTMHCNNAVLNGGNGTNLNMSGNGGGGNSYDGSPRGKTRAQHSAHHKQRGGNGLNSHSSHGFHYYGKASGGKGTHYMSNGNAASTYQRSGNNHHHHHHHNGHHQHPPMGSSPYSNSYLNGYAEDTLTNGGGGFVYDQRSGSPTKMNSMSHPPPPISSSGNSINTNGGNVSTGQISQSSPTPEQIQQQMLHPPPMPPHLQQAFGSGHPHTDTSTLPPPPPPVITSSSSAAVSSSSSLTAVNSNNSNTGGSMTTTPNGKSGNGKYTRSNGMGGPRGNKQGGSPAKDMKWKKYNFHFQRQDKETVL